MPTKAKSAKKRAYHHGNVRRALLDEAARVFAARGTLDFTLRELARSVGVTHNAPYRHFESKAELLEALRAEGFARLAAAEVAALEGAGDDARARVKALGEAYVRFALQEPTLFRLVLAHPTEAVSHAPSPGPESYALLERTLEEARVTGVARDDLSARELALVAWSLVHGLATLLSSGHLPAGEARVERYAKLLASVFFDGAAASATGGPARAVAGRSGPRARRAPERRGGRS